uniref:Uncharacterized protein n=1 Tax=Sus scrofa TaxID=9823 RepID=A0A4X1VND7_PIG
MLHDEVSIIVLVNEARLDLELPLGVTLNLADGIISTSGSHPANHLKRVNSNTKSAGQLHGHHSDSLSHFRLL